MDSVIRGLNGVVDPHNVLSTEESAALIAASKDFISAIFGCQGQYVVDAVPLDERAISDLVSSATNWATWDSTYTDELDRLTFMISLVKLVEAIKAVPQTSYIRELISKVAA